LASGPLVAAYNVSSFSISPMNNLSPPSLKAFAKEPLERYSTIPGWMKSSSVTGRKVWCLSFIIEETRSSVEAFLRRESFSAPEMEGEMEKNWQSSSNCGWASSGVLGCAGMAFEIMTMRWNRGRDDGFWKACRAWACTA